MGGKEAPCQPESLLRVIQEETGFPCPRRESENLDDGACFELLRVASSPSLGSMYQAWQTLLLRHVDEEHQLRLMRRVARAFGDEQIAEHLPRRMV